ncbi:glycosyltransferase [Gandjariella thermophila]|uniref:Glycosyl transferase n=1 Tax=Gandjariella thermophila TaxID=1931992 RepID=A0A4D4JCL9_9PSEU|nr:glycosyltransferase [Gandjariella thermophila]GDY33364.1 glycosyl transferase [Gandjariella thermophila]
MTTVPTAPAMTRRLRVLLWHVHGSWTTSFVQGGHTYLLPTLPEGGPWGRGRCGRPWPRGAREVTPKDLRDTDVDVVLLQRPEELELTERWTGRRPGRDLPAVYVEHNTPRGDVPNTRHPLADRADIPLVHVTHFNELMWDSGRAPTAVIPHGVVDPGERYTGELERAAVVINEPIRRWRVTGTDLLPALAEAAPLDVYGMRLTGLNERTGVGPRRLRPVGDLDSGTLATELARHRVYLHTARWTSLGLSLIEAMHLGMPVVAVASTEAPRAVPPEAGAVSADVGELAGAVRELIDDPDTARRMGKHAREFALAHHGLQAFLHRWDSLLARTLRAGGPIAVAREAAARAETEVNR